ncbi:hypothetical protein OB955_09725 [Halobacteria archaeon AArc-m2/3/4]|uniref:DUF7992 domain-containing protein n=1 Tax=Natronoglomus mannanivorans TaxID=2979990 RepID=A0ABT2QDM1_9EURY|nr:hypothetical protein [Halobacteria archaeon AArc-m2/3/4]
MTLDVEIPEPPTIRAPQDPGDYDAVDEPEDWTGDTAPREALAEFLREGAWADAFDEWREQTYMGEEEFQLVLDLGLIDEFDFYWNPSAADVGYRAPTLPESGTLSASDETLEEVDAEGIEEELDELGRTVSEVLENRYIDRSGEEFGFFDDR